MPRDRRRVGVARVLDDAGVEGSEKLRGVLDGELQLGLVGLVRVDAEQHVLPPYEMELRRRVVEPSDSEDVADSVPVQPGVGGDDELVLSPDLDVDQVNESSRHRIAATRRVGIVRQELEIGHVWHYGVGNFGRFAHRVEIESEIAFGGSIHSASHRQAAAVVLQGRNILSHCSGYDHVQVFGVWPYSG